MWIADEWKDYEVIDTSDGEKRENGINKTENAGKSLCFAAEIYKINRVQIKIIYLL